METLFLLIAALLSTTTMTAFSYMVSASFRDLYKEPVLLQYVLSEWDMQFGKTAITIISWLLHYLIGLVFVLGYLIPVDLGWYEITWISGLVFGAIIGFIGIIGWEIMFRLSGHTPIKQLSVYYIQLFLAHIIFAITTLALCRVYYSL